jgi:NADH:ubiquinone oxidoreductase subunit 4 (subunit M)
LAKVMPVYAAIFAVVALASVGVPGTNGFIGEFMVITGTFVSINLGHYGKVHAVLASAGVILAAVYMLSVVQKVFFGPLDNPKNRSLKDLNSREAIALAPLVALIFVIGLFPALFLSRMTPSVEATLDHYRDSVKEWKQMTPDRKDVVMLDRRVGPLDRGYPLSPAERKEKARKERKVAAANPASREQGGAR